MYSICIVCIRTLVFLLNIVSLCEITIQASYYDHWDSPLSPPPVILITMSTLENE